jgi:hypothetical protein
MASDMAFTLVSDAPRVHADRAGLDVRLNIPYLSHRMTRLLLTLLALLTGLVAQTAPTQARIGAGAEVAAQLTSISKRAPVVSQMTSRPASGNVWELLFTQPITPQRTAPIPAVLTGIDRARK